MRQWCVAATLMMLSVHVALPSAQSAQTAAPASRPPGPPGPAPVGIAVPTDYVIGSEDVLGVLFWREPDLSGDVTVRPDGKITLSLIGDVAASGLTPETLRDQLQQAGSRFLADANVTVVVRQINSRKVFITGQVGMPGAFPLGGPRNVLQLIAMAGGLGEYAESDKITIIRTDHGRPVTLKFNYKDVSKGKKLEQNIQLQPGDTVVVP
jgi:polysaccharide export outer membrane protein